VPIYFYGYRRKPYGCFSNFSPHGFELDGSWWPTSEHYFQAQKFAGTPHVEEVRRAGTPKEAAQMGRDRCRPLRPDWEQVKDEVMRRAVRRKFEAHPDIRAVLLSTGDELIVEKSPRDSYWGCGADGSGQNRLGQILMEVRESLRRGEEQPAAYRRDRFTISTERARLDVAAIHNYLANRSYWAQGRSLEVVRRSIEHSLCFGVYDGEQQVGFARVVTDYATFAWLCDVFVLDSHRGLGLGKWLIECVVGHAELQGLKHFILATRDAHELYRRYGGFEGLPHPEKLMVRAVPGSTAGGERGRGNAGSTR
jgi:ribA/ribD-fused uncharacterized protein